MPDWTLEYADASFERFYLSLKPYEQAVVEAALTTVLKVHGIASFDGGWGKPLGDGLFEFRIQRSLDAILTLAGSEATGTTASGRRISIRIFCTFHGDRIVLLLHGYDKGRDPSSRRQQKEIARARAVLKKWRGSR
ncbi:hypothetical protein [Microcella sp.]|uniref:hypothetical protein n=1 Tax=Microcella sp. TaxID=1913979 RepID=UPI002569DC9F|nr:hypothetical protein [Microcella sp.]MBX9470385.1 type II toxin-antitoxin system RelE/ParE family toxin [Microcella sp.]